MKLRHKLVRMIEKAVRVRIYRTLPPGVELADDIRGLRGFRMRVILDVGANRGQSCDAFLRTWPEARIFCLEPAPATFEELSRRFAGVGGVRCFRLAAGAVSGKAKLFIDSPTSEMNRLVEEGAAGCEEVEVTAVDDFCRAHGIDEIDFLKVDTEGHDLEVLRGAASMLETGRVGLVRVEASMNPDNRYHAALEDFRKYLEPMGYRLFKFYEQMHEWPTGRPCLRRADAVFVSARWNRGEGK